MVYRVLNQPTALGITPVYVKASDAAAMLGMRESWFWAAVRDGKMPAGTHFGEKATRWKVSEVLAAADRFNDNVEKVGV